MKKITTVVAMMAASIISFSVNAQTAEEIVSKHIEAIGGKDVISKISSIYMEGSMAVMGNESPTTMNLLVGKGYKTETEFNGAKSIQCYTDKDGWTINPMAGGAAQPMPEDQYKANRDQIYAGGVLEVAAQKGYKMESLGKEGSNYKIKITTKDNAESLYYIDAATYYVSKIERKSNMNGQDVTIIISLADYKKTDIGLMVPFTFNMDLGQFQLNINYTKAEINKKIDPAIFVMPK